MAKGAYIGVGGVAHKIKKGYIGVNGVARKIKKAYIGIGGVARPCWSEGLDYYGTITPLSSARDYLAATTVGNYALFGGGADTANCCTVDAYDTALTRTTPTALSYYNMCAAACIGKYAMIAGPYGVNAYDTALTRTTPTALSVERDQFAATTVGNFALFGGGIYRRTRCDTVDAYTAAA